uniref:Vps53 N-terminal domain-containing protein n=1 Tax=Brassica campestris TaxID=3711 RepID=A0A3P5Z5N2_BRACM|nr:unnamed protein product [Brassica rapa]
MIIDRFGLFRYLFGSSVGIRSDLSRRRRHSSPPFADRPRCTQIISSDFGFDQAMDKSSALEYINQMFPTEASLSGVEPLMQKIHGEIRRVDASILSAVRQQSNSGTKAKEDLADATRAVEELSYKIQEIKSKAEQSEAMVQEICRDIKKLDFAKKNITTTITALHRLTMLVSAVEQLQVMASKRQYKEAAAQLEAVNQLCNHFEAYRDVPKIMELREKLNNIKQVLKSHVFSDFSSSTDIAKRGDKFCNMMSEIGTTCLLAGMRFCTSSICILNNNPTLRGVNENVNENSIKRKSFDTELLVYEIVVSISKFCFSIWMIHFFGVYGCMLCCIVVVTTLKQVESILVNMKEKPEVATLLLALQRTVEFEKELEKKFGGDVPTSDIGDDIEEIGTWENNSQNISKIRKKYEKKFAAGQESGENEKTGNKDLSAPGAGFNFRGIISSCFEPHLTPYIELEEKTLMERLEKVVQEETWDIEDGSQNNVLHSSTQLFSDIKKSLKRCSVLTKNQTLFNLFKVFQRVLKAYATKLFLKLPKGGTGIVAAATGMDGQIKVSDRDERVICYIVNSAEYCHKTSGELAEKVSEIIDPHYAEGVDMSEVQDEFSAVITKSLVTLVLGIETKFDNEMAAMTRVPWGTLDSVGDQSGYVNGINTILSSSIPVLGNLLTPVYFQFFLDKLASSLGPRFYANIFRCKQLSETGAQQMLLDTQAMKTILLEIPSLARQTSTAASYSKFVSREMSRAEALLKVILSPIDSVADTYRALFPEGTPMEFQRILELKGLKKADQQSILDDFNKHGPGLTQPSVSTAMRQPVPTTPAPPMAITNQATAAGFIANSEDVLTRAAALGRGAATTGFKKFIALTEAAKDRKDGPLRRLFNA